jgi:GntR family transcriptional regulator/MocR family aminotransferase
LTARALSGARHDCCESLYRLDGHGRGFFVGTFSLSMLPALRIAYVVAPNWAVPALSEAREALDWHGPAIEQGALAAFIAEGHLARHIRRIRASMPSAGWSCCGP